jgi:membrane protease YdiL (CAAX protease family)
MALPTFMSWVETRWILPLPPEERPLLAETVFLFGKLVQFSTPLLFVVMTEPRRLRLARPSLRGMLAGLAFALVGTIGTFVLYYGFLRGGGVLAETAGIIRNWLEKFGFHNLDRFLVFAFFMCVPHALLEEYYWRWFVFDRLRRQMSWRPAALLSALAFMSHHVLVLAYYLPHYFWSVGLGLSLSVALGGFVWAWIYQRTGNLYAPWLSHLLVDAVIMVVGWDMVTG